MKKYRIWFRLLNKRLIRKPLFLLTLFLLPVIVCGIRFSLADTDAIMRIAIYTPSQKNPDSLEQRITRELIDSSNHTITFYQCSSQEELYRDIEEKQASCGYLLPEDLEKKLQQYKNNSQPVLKSIRLSSEKSTRIIDEIVYSNLYTSLAFDLLLDHVTSKTGLHDPDTLKILYERYRKGEVFIEFQTESGNKNEILQDSNTNYMLLPIRGITATLLLLSGMTGTLFWYQDRNKNLFVWLRTHEKKTVRFLYLTVPVLMTWIPGILALWLTGISVNMISEALTMLLYLFTIIAFCNLLCVLLPKMNQFSAVIPLLTAGSLIVCPVFINLSGRFPAITYLEAVTPVSYYLKAAYSTEAKVQMLLFGMILTIITFSLESVCHNPESSQ